jgi:hypothetical protein
MTVFAAPIGSAFVSDPVVIGEVARILPVISAGFFAAGPLMMIAMHFQAIGDAGRAAILGLSKPYLFAMPLTFALAGSVGEPGIWLAAPVAEVLLLGLTVLVLAQVAQGRSPCAGVSSPTGRCGHDTRSANDLRGEGQAKRLRADLAEQGDRDQPRAGAGAGRAGHGFRDWNALHAAMRDRPARKAGRSEGG